uniref:Uncharacterized protein n=1 Tax=Arundo donax TaxID=35708 RepID=A0A0A9HXQ8_ARUDO
MKCFAMIEYSHILTVKTNQKFLKILLQLYSEKLCYV